MKKVLAASELDCRLNLSRRNLLIAAGMTAAAASFLGPGQAEGTPIAGASADSNLVPPVHGLHLQFGADASAQMTVSWLTSQPVRRPRTILGRPDGKFERTADAVETSYIDAKSGQRVYVYHAALNGLASDTDYLYAALHDGADPQFGTFRTAPRGRAAFTFTSFGDQGTPTLGRRFEPPPGVIIANPPYVNDNLGSPAAADTTLGVEHVQPLFHLFNGDLSYANIAEDRVRTWWDFWANNGRSARNRPWMPSPGNHENELGNGPIGYRAYQTYFSLPAAGGQTDVTRGLWYAFTAGSVRVVSLANDDVVYQDSGNSYVHGYSGGAQRAWLEGELAATRRNRDIDWIVVCMHQVAMSTADKSNGADLGIRQEWLPLFDRYGVDLVVCGHEHHYERSHPIRGRQTNVTLTPIPAATATDVIDTTKGTVHMIIGGGGTSAPTNQLFFNPPACRVITAVAAPATPGAKRQPVYVKEDAPWSAVRNAAHSYGFAAFRLDPGSRPGDDTTLTVTYYDVVGSGGQLAPFETFVLRRPRNG